MKIRLGKIYKNLIRDKNTEKDNFLRKQFVDLAMVAFPDLIDSLLLGDIK
jgi:hypothetical protein